MLRIPAHALIGLASLLVATVARSQDVRIRGERNGVQPPGWVEAILATNPDSFEFVRAWKGNFEQVKERRAFLAVAGIETETLTRQQAAAYKTVVAGTMQVPVLPLLFSNTSTEPYQAAALQRRLFSPVPAHGLTLTQYYAEVSRNRFNLTGEVFPWIRVPGRDDEYEGVDNGGPPALGRLLTEALDSADARIDFRRFDRNADGFVDVVAFVQPQSGGECGNSNIWSHRWVYGAATGTGRAYRTRDGVLISDYVIQPAFECDDATAVHIGVFAHEFGHALGLPDLYSTARPPTNAGLGMWSLMSHGGWNQTNSPAHLDAWSKVELGWMPVIHIEGSVDDMEIKPAAKDGAALRIDIPGSPGEYYLLENRQRVGSDMHLLGTGLLIWHVDSTVIANGVVPNTVQNLTAHRGIHLIQADGQDQLDDPQNEGDAGDVFPGAAAVTLLDATTRPGLHNYGQRQLDFSIRDIRDDGNSILLDIRMPKTIAAAGQGDATAPAVHAMPARPGARPAGDATQGPSEGPLAYIRFRGGVHQSDLDWLAQQGYDVKTVFTSGGAIVTVPALQQSDPRRTNERVTDFKVQQRGGLDAQPATPAGPDRE